MGKLANNLHTMVLRNNKFQGIIPTTFTNTCHLEVLNMQNNHFEGMVPQALANCKELKILDMGNNHMSGTVPSWLSTLQNLEVLVLRSNRLHGKVSASSTKHPFPKLRIVDLSNNEFTGNLPIQYFYYMKPTRKGYDYNNSKEDFQYFYQASVPLRVKGTEYEVKEILYIYTAIDLSCNKFQGEVPKVIGDLSSLALLNLSHNSLTGPIPSVLGNMETLQSLDLSSNQLSGVIPNQLTSLTFLAVLNLSENHLTGEIPLKGQFSTFGNDSYLGNSALCGLPLTKKCMHAVSPPQEVGNDGDDEDDVHNGLNWELILMGYGCGLICGLSSGYIAFKMGRPRWFVRYIELLQLKLIRTRMKKRVR